MDDFIYIDEIKGLREMSRHLQGKRRVSVDLESDSYHNYGEKICLMQVSTDSRIYIVDALKVDMAPIASLIQDTSKEKVFHDVDYDGRMLLTYLGVKPVPIFDTMIAARILGREKVGLADLLSEYFDVTLDKAFQKADWSRRPLGENMLSYAAQDVAYLLPLRDRMEKEIEGMSRSGWAREEFSRLVDNLEAMPERRATFLRVKGARELSPRELAVLQKLLDWREGEAKKLDLPSFKIVGTERLLRIARLHPRGYDQLQRSGILTDRQIARFGRGINRAVEKGMKVSREELPSFPEPVRHKRDYMAERLLRCFKKARDSKAKELDMDPGFVMPNAMLKSLARARPRDLAGIKGSGLLKKWQLEVMGDSLAGCLQKEGKRRS
jgi:ribonuclease D